MNKDKNWLKNEIEKIWHSGHPRLGEVVEYEGLKNLIEQLEEPMKIPELPKFVADWIEEAKKSRWGILALFDSDEFPNEKVEEWLTNAESGPKNSELAARAWLDGYKIEEEKLYYLKLKEDLAEQLLLTRHKYLNVLIGKTGQAYTFDDKMGYSSYFKTKLTKEEVEIWKNKLNELEFDIVEVTE